jgi:hypothetical protein
VLSLDDCLLIDPKPISGNAISTAPRDGFFIFTNMKDAYYFPHDSNAKDDPKMILLIEELGMEGYGIFWMLIESLRDQPDYRASLLIVPALARRYNTTQEKVKTVIQRYDLFVVEDDTFFYSESLNRRMEALAEKRLKRQLAGQKGGNAKAMLQQSYSKPLAVKESKVKESKEKERKVEKSTYYARPNSLTDPELLVFFTNNGSTHIEAANFYDYYDSQNWMKANNMPISNWQSLASNWIRRSLHDPRYKPKKEKKIIMTPDFSHLEHEEN